MLAGITDLMLAVEGANISLIFFDPLFCDTWKCLIPLGKICCNSSSSSIIFLNFLKAVLIEGKDGSKSVTNLYFLISFFLPFLS